MRNYHITKFSFLIGSLLYSMEAFAHGISSPAIIMMLFGIYFVLHIVPLIYISFFPVKGDHRKFHVLLCLALIGLFWLSVDTLASMTSSDRMVLVGMSPPMVQAIYVFYRRMTLKKRLKSKDSSL